MTPLQQIAMTQALELLESVHVATHLVWKRHDCCEALRQALKESPIPSYDVTQWWWEGGYPLDNA